MLNKQFLRSSVSKVRQLIVCPLGSSQLMLIFLLIMYPRASYVVKELYSHTELTKLKDKYQQEYNENTSG